MALSAPPIGPSERNPKLNWLYPLADDTTTWEHVWRAGGAAMYPLMLLAMGVVPVAIGLLALHLTDGRKRGTRLFALFAIGYGILPVALGALGQASGLRMMEEALATIDPEDHEIVRMHGEAEAGVPQRLGLLIGVPMLLLGGGMLLTARGKPEEEAPEAATPQG